MTKIYFENTATGKRYEVVGIDKAPDGSETITLKGEFAEFKEPYSKERFKKLGYKPVKVAT